MLGDLASLSLVAVTYYRCMDISWFQKSHNNCTPCPYIGRYRQRDARRDILSKVQKEDPSVVASIKAGRTKLLKYLNHYGKQFALKPIGVFT